MKKTKTKLSAFWEMTLTLVVLISAFTTVSFARETSSQDVLNRSLSLEGANKPLKTALTGIKRETNLSGLNSALNESSPFASHIESNVTITGTVLDDNNEPLVGASVIVKGTTTGAITDVDGKFSLSIPEGNATIVIQFIGYQSKEVAIGKETTFTIRLEANDKTLNEVVVVGYGTANRKDILGAVGSVKDKDIEQITPVNTFDAMQGRLAGVQITSNGGPGSGSDIRIRGTSTFSGGVNPLYIVDGQQLEDINNLNPNDIANIEILKDGASAAIYGSKSANGVVVITTKAGKAGEMKLNVDYARSTSNLASSISIANTRERIYYENARAGNDPLAIPADSLNLLFQNSNDLNKLLTRPSDRHQINATLSGGAQTAVFIGIQVF